MLPGFKPLPEPSALPSGLRLLGYALPAAVSPGEAATLALLWSLPPDFAAYRDLAREFIVFSHAVDHAGRVVDNYESEFLRDEYWRGGDRLVTFHRHEIPAGDGPELLWFDLGAYLRVDHAAIPWRDGRAPKLGPLKVSPPKAVPPPQVAAGFRFGAALALEGYGLAPREPVAGERLRVDLHWRALSRPDGDFAVSVQVLDGAGRLVAQHDGPPAGGDYPTGYWEEGEVVLDSHEVELPRGISPGAYSLVVVVYDAATHERLPVAKANELPRSDSACLGSLRVGSASR